MSRAAAIFVALALTWTAGAASAQTADDLNLLEQRFAPSPHAYDYLSIQSSHVPDTWKFNAGLLLNWSAKTMVFKDGRGEEDTILDGRLTADLMFSMSFWKYFSLGLVLPLNVANLADDPNGAFSPGTGGPIDRGNIEDFTVGDLRISPKVRFLDAKESVVGVAFSLDMTLPTGSKDALASDDGLTLFPRLIVDLDLDRFRAALNFGYKYRDDYELRWLEVKSEWLIGLAASYFIIPENLELLGEIEMTAKLSDFFADGNTDYMEGRLALRYMSDSGLYGTIGGGAGFMRAYGSPMYRLFAGVGYTPRHVVRDLDGDGFEDDVDRCVAEPEDRDGFQDDDGCPDPDNDGDGILDTNDTCPNDAEDMDRFEDTDGCPDPDNDGDGVLDTNDKCPNDAEDKDGFEDEDGCPDPDNDGDRILDAVDKCPNEPENYNECQDDDGCPEPGKVCVAEEKIVIMDKIYFKTGKATIEPRSFPILDEVVSVLQANPQVKKLRIEGHTDNVGRPKRNMRLSTARARSVMIYLIKAGIDRARLEYRGYGQDQPIAPNDTDEGRSRNRRVEFTIIEHD